MSEQGFEPNYTLPKPYVQGTGGPTGGVYSSVYGAPVPTVVAPSGPATIRRYTLTDGEPFQALPANLSRLNFTIVNEGGVNAYLLTSQYDPYISSGLIIPANLGSVSSNSLAAFFVIAPTATPANPCIIGILSEFIAP